MDCDKSLVESFKRDPQVRKIVSDHAEINTPRQLLSVAFDWTVMAGAIAVSLAYPHPLLYLAVVVVIAARQHALLVVMHEGAHFRISKNIKVNDFISNMLAAYPVMISTLDYRVHHTAHHKYTNGEQDPDWVRKIPLQEWQFPQSKSAITKTLLQQIAVGGWQWISLMVKMSKKDWKKGFYWAALLGTVAVTGTWKEFLLYWMVPLATLFPMFQRIRSISEHFGLVRSHELNGSRNTLAGPIESFFLSPHDVNYHLAHHLFPSVPHYNLKSLHKSLRAHPVYAEHAHNNDSFIAKKNSVWKDLQTIEGHEQKVQKAA
ncbi:fatty acid desaturase family protein [Bdellovibrio bacteriovorus]|uniref:fatty acid desaturase family protein n=1 Tax=Bdellovibrio bacteriovorus TaxID=959 RepID=UPI0035A624CD